MKAACLFVVPPLSFIGFPAAQEVPHDLLHRDRRNGQLHEAVL